MHFLFVTYRWGNDLLGGAELHHRRLADELVDAGHEVSVITSTGHGITNFRRWGVLWIDLADEEREASEPTVNRLHRRVLSQRAQAQGARHLQQAMEQEEAEVSFHLLQTLTRDLKEPITHLLSGWHPPESHDGHVLRWSHKIAFLFVAAGKMEFPLLILAGTAPRDNTLRLYAGDVLLGELTCKAGWFRLHANLPSGFRGILRLELASITRNTSDHRTLGVCVQEVYLQARGQTGIVPDLNADFRALGRARLPEWQAYLLDRALGRDPLLNRLFDRLRGPMIPALRREIARAGADQVIHCNMPWANLSSVREGELAMPLWHVEDEFYYWQHWIEALRKTRFVLANTPYTAESFFPSIGVKAHFVGPPIWEPEVDISEEEKVRFRGRYSLEKEDFVVLTVCRKSREKRYDSIAAAVQELASTGIRVRMIGVGPDIDMTPFHFYGCQWVGKLLDHDLQVAYAACDAFALMSESESFGMVIPEAWHHGKPVIVNRYCSPAASLVEEGLDGMLAAPGKELVASLLELITSPLRAKAMGREGQNKAREHYVRGAAARRLLDALAKGADPVEDESPAKETSAPDTSTNEKEHTATSP